MDITIKLRQEIARSLQGNQEPSAEATEILRLARDRGLSLKPVHPGAADPLLSPYFHVEVPDEKAEEIIEALNKSGLVEGAYAKPPDELP